MAENTHPAREIVGTRAGRIEPILLGDLANSSVTNGKLANGGSNVVVPGALFDISASDLEQVVLHAVAALTITQIGLIWNEATTGSGAAEGDITIGVTTTGAEVVAATPYDVSQATGDYQALTIVDGSMAAAESLFVSHDQADSAAGTYFICVKYDLD